MFGNLFFLNVYIQHNCSAFVSVCCTYPRKCKDLLQSEIISVFCATFSMTILTTNNVMFFYAENEADIILTTCSQCHNCSSLLYDEEIMSNWSAEDSNLNTVCQCCNKPTVPLLTVTITGQKVTSGEAFSVPYLNPLVLRKELENILAQEGDLTLSDSKFVEEHPIIYWNLVWTFERINVQSHLPNLYFKSKAEVQSLSTNNNDDDKKGDSGANGDEDGEDSADNSASYRQPVERGADPLTQDGE